jgi:hypothetical protein
MKIKKFLILPAMLIICGTYAQNAKEFIEKSIEQVTFDAFEMSSNLNIYDNKGNKRTRSITTVSKKFGSVTKIKSKFTAPAEVKGTTVLIHDYVDKNADTWIYLPATRKTRRIASSEHEGSFMGSEFSYSNMSTPNIANYDYKLLGTEPLEEMECFKVEIAGKTLQIQKNDGFARQVNWIDKLNHLSRKTQFFDSAGKLLKTQTFREYKKMGSKYFCFILEMKNEVNGRRSVIQTSRFEPASFISEASFSPANLE